LKYPKGLIEYAVLNKKAPFMVRKDLDGAINVIQLQNKKMVRVLKSRKGNYTAVNTMSWTQLEKEYKTLNRKDEFWMAGKGLLRPGANKQATPAATQVIQQTSTPKKEEVKDERQFLQWQFRDKCKIAGLDVNKFTFAYTAKPQFKSISNGAIIMDDPRPLPQRWRKLTAPDGRTYYANDQTHATSWTHPRGPLPDFNAYCKAYM